MNTFLYYVLEMVKTLLAGWLIYKFWPEAFAGFTIKGFPHVLTYWESLCLVFMSELFTGRYFIPPKKD